MTIAARVLASGRESPPRSWTLPNENEARRATGSRGRASTLEDPSWLKSSRGSPHPEVYAYDRVLDDSYEYPMQIEGEKPGLVTNNELGLELGGMGEGLEEMMRRNEETLRIAEEAVRTEEGERWKKKQKAARVAAEVRRSKEHAQEERERVLSKVNKIKSKEGELQKLRDKLKRKEEGIRRREDELTERMRELDEREAELEDREEELQRREERTIPATSEQTHAERSEVEGQSGEDAGHREGEEKKKTFLFRFLHRIYSVVKNKLT